MKKIYQHKQFVSCISYKSSINEETEPSADLKCFLMVVYKVNVEAQPC